MRADSRRARIRQCLRDDGARLASPARRERHDDSAARYCYEWRRGKNPRVLRTERQVHGARDGGEPNEHPGTRDAKGEIFNVSCPVPVTAPATFRA